MKGTVHQRVAVKQQQERSLFVMLGLLGHHHTDAIITCLLIAGLFFPFRHRGEQPHDTYLGAGQPCYTKVV